MLGRRRGGSSLIPGKGDAALAAARVGAPPRPRCAPAAAHLAPSPGRLCPGIPRPQSPPAPASPLCPRAVVQPRPLSAEPGGPARLRRPPLPPAPAFPCLGLPFGPAGPRRGRPPALSRPLPPPPRLSLSLAGLAPLPSPRGPSGRLPGMRRPGPPGLDFCPHLYPGFPSSVSPHPCLLYGVLWTFHSRPPTPTPCVPGFCPFAPSCLPFPTRPFSLRFHQPPSLALLFLYTETFRHRDSPECPVYSFNTVVRLSVSCTHNVSSVLSRVWHTVGLVHGRCSHVLPSSSFQAFVLSRWW